MLVFFFFCYRKIDEYLSSSKCDSLIHRNKDQKKKNANEKHNDRDDKEMQRERERGENGSDRGGMRLKTASIAKAQITRGPFASFCMPAMPFCSTVALQKKTSQLTPCF